MGVEGSGRIKRGSAEISKEDNESNYSGHTKKKSKNQPTYNGPPAYLLDAKRTDPFADPRNVIQDKDGTNRPINYGGKSHPSTQKISDGGPAADTDRYIYEIPPTESRSEREANRAASEAIAFAGQDQLLSNPLLNFKTNRSNNSLPRPRRNTPSSKSRTKLGAIKLGLKLDLKQTSISTRGRTSSQTGIPNSNIPQQATQNSLETPQQSHISQLPQNSASKGNTSFNWPVSNQRSLKNTPTVDSGACSPPTEEIVPGADFLNDPLAATYESELRSHHIVPSPAHQHNEKILLSPPEPARHNLNRKIGQSPLRHTTTAEQAPGFPSPTRLSSRLHQAFSRSDSKDNLLNNATPVEFDSFESLDSTPSKNSLPKRGNNRTGFATRGDLQLSRNSSQRSSTNLPDNDALQPKDTKPVQTYNPRRASDNDITTGNNDIITGSNDIITSANDIISPQGENFLPSSSKVNKTTTKFAQRNKTGTPLKAGQTVHTKQEPEHEGTQNKQKAVLPPFFSNSLDRVSVLPSENAAPNRDRRYSVRMSDNYPERGMLDQEETLDQMDSYESDEYFSNNFMTDEEYAFKLQAEEYGQAFEERSVSAVPTAAQYSNVRAESPSSAGTLRGIAGRENRNYSNYNPRNTSRESSPSHDPSFTDAGNLWRQNNSHHSRLSGAQNLSPRESFFSRNPQMSPRPSPLRHEQTRSPEVTYAPMFRRSPEERGELERRRAKRKERDDDEIYEGMRKSKVAQRGWNGERESDRRETIRSFQEAEDAKTRAQVAKESAASGARRPSVMTERVSLRHLREGSERVQTRQTLEAMVLEDTADRMMDEATSSMMSRHINMDEIIGEARGRSNVSQVSGTNERRAQGNRALGTAESRRRSLPQGNRAIQTAQGRRRSLPQGNGPTERGRQISQVPDRIESPSPEMGEQQQTSSEGPERIESPSPSPPTSPATQPRGHQRVLSGAGSLKENEHERERPPPVRRPADQVRGFGNDITAWAEEERKLQEAMDAAREANAANRRRGNVSSRRRPANLPDQEIITGDRRSANADDQEANAENQQPQNSNGSARHQRSGETETFENSP